MPDLIHSSGRVHWLGAGLSTGSGLRRVARAAAELTLWNRTPDKARALVERLGIADKARIAAFSTDALRSELQPGDVVICLLPVTQHAEIVAIAAEAGAHYVSTSYVSPAVAEAAEGMAERGLVCLVEAGLDPGIDHLLSHKLVAEAEAALRSEEMEVSFHSYCGGVPVRPTPFRYKFSWAPAGVLLALNAPARWIEGGRQVDCRHPWEAVVRCDIGSERFETYPNRDSTPFVQQYGFPAQWRVADFVRGTLRLEGWRTAWEPVFETVKTGDRAAIGALAESLAETHSYAPGEPDRIVMGVRLEARRDGRVSWRSGYALDFQGTVEESAMARAVSHTAAIAAIDVLNDQIRPGLRRAVQAVGDCDRWLTGLAEVGIAPTPSDLSIKAA